jgi:hypothetical protein
MIRVELVWPIVYPSLVGVASLAYLGWASFALDPTPKTNRLQAEGTARDAGTGTGDPNHPGAVHMDPAPPGCLKVTPCRAAASRSSPGEQLRRFCFRVKAEVLL